MRHEYLGGKGLLFLFDCLPAELGIDLVPLKAGVCPFASVGAGSGPELPDEGREWMNLLQKGVTQVLVSIPQTYLGIYFKNIPQNTDVTSVPRCKTDPSGFLGEKIKLGVARFLTQEAAGVVFPATLVKTLNLCDLRLGTTRSSFHSVGN